MNFDLPVLRYIYKCDHTTRSTGFFSCEPASPPSLEEGLEILAQRPLDSFFRQFLLRQALEQDRGKWESQARELIADSGYKPDGNPAALASFLLEWKILGAIPADGELTRCLENMTVEFSTPFGILRGRKSASPELANKWVDIFQANIHGHRVPAAKEFEKLPPLYPEEDIEKLMAKMAGSRGFLERKKRELEKIPIAGETPIDPKITAARAEEALAKANLLDGPLMRHEASLSPIALLRQWRVNINTANNRNRHILKGSATAYGRGLSLAGAKASCFMEIVERASAYSGFEQSAEHSRPCLRLHGVELRQDTFASLFQKGIAAIDPATLCGEPASRSARFHWVEGRDSAGSPVLAPAQAVFLFSNLDEPDFFDSLGSTGLAAGNTIIEAKLAALTEILERHAHASMPFIIENCFQLTARDTKIRALLEDYQARNIRVQFQDISLESGFPAYRCFVTARDGAITQATGANLDGRRAAMSALTETPWPYVWAKPAPWGAPSGPGLKNLPLRYLEDLPDFSLPAAEANLRMLENMCLEQGYNPVYVDITRADLNLPVARAILPCLTVDTEFSLSRLPQPELFARWRQAGKIYKK